MLRSSRRLLVSLSLVTALGLALAPRALAQQGTPPPPGRNAELTQAFADVARRASAHVLRLERAGRACGYGVVVRPGLVLTTGTVVGQATALRARGQGVDLEARVAGRDAEHDLVLLRLSGPGPAPIALGRAADLVVGRFVVSVGSEPAPLAVGVVSALGRTVEPQPNENVLLGLFSEGNEGPTRHYPSVLQHDGPVVPEAFGSALVDREGALVGLNVGAPWRGSSHAVPVEVLLARLDALASGDGASPWLGIQGDDRTAGLPQPYAFGLEVQEAQGPAAAAGVQRGDVVVAVDGRAFASADAFAQALGTRRPGDRVRLTLARGGRTVEVEVVLGAR